MNKKIYLRLFLALIFVIFLFGCSPTLDSQSDSQLETKTALQTLDTNSERPLPYGLLGGNTAPGFSVMDIDGNIISKESFKQTPVLLYFFATWCPYCMKDLTALSPLYLEYEPDVAILAIDMDLSEGNEKIQSYKQQFPKLSSVLFARGNTDILSSYQIKYTTTKYAIGRNGSILYAGAGELDGARWRILLDALRDS